MTIDVAHCGAILTDGPFDTEQLTILVVTGVTVDEVAAALGIDTSVEPVEHAEYSEDSDVGPGYYWMAEIAGGSSPSRPPATQTRASPLCNG